ncbi:MAG TPA: hypothetical protein VEL07_19345 [Planctomycetota bacterium]|nr:hypothetical protein [Planctomycetota bacterium]
MLKELDNYDWKEAFGYAGEPDTCATAYQDGPKVSGVLGYTGSIALFTRADVAEIAGMVDGENDEAPWIIYGRLNDGRWFFLEAGCDYTGWDCQAGGSAVVADDRDTIVRMAIPKDKRARFCLPEPT